MILYHHPFSRAAGVVWMLEEVGVPYELRFVDLSKGEQKRPEVLANNPMGKLPVLEDGSTVVTESGAIALYLADRYAYGRLAPTVDDPLRGPYLRWAFFAPSVIEPGCLAKANGWTFRESNAGWGTHEAMITAMENAIEGKQFILGNEFSMADVVFGGTLRYMLMVKLLESRPTFAAYVERLDARPAYQRAQAKNNQVRDERGLQVR
jgi:glutathione S-transferase